MSKPSKAPSTASTEESKKKNEYGSAFLFVAKEESSDGASYAQLYSKKDNKCFMVSSDLLKNSGIALGEFCYGVFADKDQKTFSKFKKPDTVALDYLSVEVKGSTAYVILTGKIVSANKLIVFKNGFANAVCSGSDLEVGKEYKMQMEFMSKPQTDDNKKYFFKGNLYGKKDLDLKMEELKLETSDTKKNETPQRHVSALKVEATGTPKTGTPSKKGCNAIVLKTEKKNGLFHHTVWVTSHNCEGLYVSESAIAKGLAFKGQFDKQVQETFWTCTKFENWIKTPIETEVKDDEVRIVVKIMGVSVNDYNKKIAKASLIGEIVGSVELKITEKLVNKQVLIRYLKHPDLDKFRWVAVKIIESN